MRNETTTTTKITATKFSDLSKLEAVFQRIYDLFPDTSVGFLPVDLPKFHRNDIVARQRLGRGCFSDVFEIQQIKDHYDESDNLDSAEFSVANRFLTAHGKTRYALKCLQEGARQDPVHAWTNFAGPVVETRLLSQLVHPNIIRLQVIADREALCPNYFIVLDKLYGTL